MKYFFSLFFLVLFIGCASTDVPEPPEPEAVPEQPAPEPPPEPEPAPEPPAPEPPPEPEPVPEPPAPELPDWVKNPPLEEGAIYGVGGDAEQAKANIKAIADIVWQLKTRVNGIIAERSAADDEVKKSIAVSLEEQITNVAMRSSGFVDEFHASDGQTWILARMPLASMLDVLESVLISHSQELKTEESAIEMLVEYVEKQVALNRLERPSP